MGLRVFLNYSLKLYFFCFYFRKPILEVIFHWKIIFFKYKTLATQKNTDKKHQYPPKQALNNVEMLNFFGSPVRMGIKNK